MELENSITQHLTMIDPKGDWADILWRVSPNPANWQVLFLYHPVFYLFLGTLDRRYEDTHVFNLCVRIGERYGI